MQVSQSDIQYLLSVVPNTAANADIISELQNMLSASRVEKVLYTYSNILTAAGAANALAAGAISNPVSTNIQADAMFIWTATTYWANKANAENAAQLTPNVRVLITDLGSGRQLSDQPEFISSLAGDGRLPYVLPEPRIIAANGALQCVYTNVDVAAGYNLFIFFKGYKLYRQTAAQ